MTTSPFDAGAAPGGAGLARSVTTSSRSTASRGCQTVRTGYSRALVYPAALLTLGAAAIHVAVIQDHLDQYLIYGVFFIAVSVGQLVLAALTIQRPTRRLFSWAVLATVGFLALWVLTRTVSLPIGPEQGRPEDFGFSDVITALLEGTSVLLFGILAAQRPRPARPAGRWWVAGLAAFPAVVQVPPLAFFGFQTGFNHAPYAVNMSSELPGQPSRSMQSLVEQPGSEPVRRFTLEAQVADVDSHQAWTYNGSVPGPELRVAEGDRVEVTLINHLPVATTIHWHGLRLPNAEDGVAGLTQDAVPTGACFTYEFVARDPGTYWYHAHQDTEIQVPRGLYGALVVEPMTGPRYDRDYSVTIGDLYDEHGNDQIAVNGSPGELHLDAAPGELARLRVINATQSAMLGSTEYVVLLGAPYRVLALDGHDLAGPQDLGPELLPIGVGQRYDLVFRMPASTQVRLIDTGLDALAMTGPRRSHRTSETVLASSWATSLRPPTHATTSG